MKHVKEYELFESNNKLTKKQINFLDDLVKGKWEIDEWTGLVNVDGNFNGFVKVRISDPVLGNFMGIKFGEIKGNFDISSNWGIKSLDGCPERVTGNFRCSSTGIETLEGGPSYVGGNYEAMHCTYLVSLKGAPRKIGGDFKVSIPGHTAAPRTGKLESLQGGPVTVGGDFDCKNNNLDSLKGGPKEVGGNYVCSGNNLTSLEGAPNKKIGFLLYSDENPLSDTTIKKLFTAMSRGRTYGDAVKKLWDEIPTEDALALMYREDSSWLTMDMINQLLHKDPKRSFEIIKNLKKYNHEISKEFDHETNDISDLGALGF